LNREGIVVLLMENRPPAKACPSVRGFNLPVCKEQVSSENAGALFGMSEGAL
jgi:hypothetical protein